MQAHAPPPWLPVYLAPLWSVSDLTLLTGLVAGEAEGENESGKLGVLCVARNRLLLGFHGALFGWRGIGLAPYQFSCFWADWHVRGPTISAAIQAPESFRLCQDAAFRILGGLPDFTRGSTHYFAKNSPRPNWADHFRPEANCYTRTVWIPGPTGGHEFYAPI